MLQQREPGPSEPRCHLTKCERPVRNARCKTICMWPLHVASANAVSGAGDSEAGSASGHDQELLARASWEAVNGSAQFWFPYSGLVRWKTNGQHCGFAQGLVLGQGGDRFQAEECSSHCGTVRVVSRPGRKSGGLRRPWFLVEGSHSPSEGTEPADTSILGFQLRGCESVKFCCGSALVCAFSSDPRARLIPPQLPLGLPVLVQSQPCSTCPTPHDFFLC